MRRETSHLYAYVTDLSAGLGRIASAVTQEHPAVSIVEIGGQLYVGSLNPFARCEGCGDTFGNAISSGEPGILNPELTHSKTPPQKLSLCLLSIYIYLCLPLCSFPSPNSSLHFTRFMG